MKSSLFTCTAVIAGVVSAAQPYSTWMADSMIAHGVSKTRYYTEATFYQGIQMALNATQNNTYESFLQKQIDAVVSSNGAIVGWDSSANNLDDMLVGRTLLHLYTTTGSSKYKTAATFLRQKLNTHARTASGGFWHKDPAYPNQMWLDGLFMAEPFYAQYTSMFDYANKTAWDDILLQFNLIEQHCRNATTGLLVHGYDESKKAVWANPVTGASPHVWDRAVGWYFMALIEVLDYFPSEHAGRAKLLTYFTTLAAALKATQQSAGGWWLIMEQPYPGMAGNYIESSGTAMFTYGFVKGIRKGYLAAGDYEAPARLAYELMTEKFVARNGTEGTLNWEGTIESASLSGDASYQVRRPK
jgi:rhamnogalacturonyl hydrolase YesR